MKNLEIPFIKISMGEVVVNSQDMQDKLEKFEKALQKVGFEIIAEKYEGISNRIKSIIISGIFEDKNFSNKNLSVVLSDELHMDYSHLSSIFSRIEGRSIQQFQQEIKSERVKELLEYDELNISEIANDLGYSSAAYLSTQFKKSTGLTPSEYRLRHIRSRTPLDKV
ncbi:MAG TPA: AraC family transcriptional regulator [Gillisia sp.]|nr:AraC family transcriptional regulator [Gillisia sp.]